MSENSNKIGYRILVQSSLDHKWAKWFEGFDLSPHGANATLLSGEIADQAELHGVLVRINNLGLPLMLVVQSDALRLCVLCPLILWTRRKKSPRSAPRKGLV